MKKITSAGLLIVVGIWIAFFTGCGKDNLAKSDTLVLSVDDSKVYMNEMMYHVMLSQMRGELYASYFGTEDYWDMEYEEGVTMREALKQIAMEDAIKYEILFAMAQKEGYELTEEERKGCQEKVESIEKNMQPQQLQEDELTEEKLMEIQEKIALCTKYYNDYVVTLGVSEDASEEEKAAAFETAFEEIKKQHAIKVKNKVWNQVELGETKA